VLTATLTACARWEQPAKQCEALVEARDSRLPVAGSCGAFPPKKIDIFEIDPLLATISVTMYIY
jgi:hypothetical protein